MKTPYFLLAGLAFVVFSSFTLNEACNYAGSNMSFVKSQTEKALLEGDINKARFHTYKAIKAIQSTTSKFNDCGCKEAEVGISESLINLKASVKSTSSKGAQILLNEALEHIIDAIDALEQHELHDSAFSSKEFAMNTEIPVDTTSKKSNKSYSEIQKRIDDSLLKYEVSLQEVINSVGCTEARAYAAKVFLECEKQLLKPKLSEAKKYYNLRTKEITKKAIEQLQNCDSNESK